MPRTIAARIRLLTAPAPETNANANPLSHLSQVHGDVTHPLARTYPVPPSHARQGPLHQGYAYRLPQHQKPMPMPTPTIDNSLTSPKSMALLTPTRTHTVPPLHMRQGPFQQGYAYQPLLPYCASTKIQKLKHLFLASQ
jgi:hypothetical protein